MKIYTYGYIGSKPEILQSYIEETGAMVVDTRYSAMSRVPRWRKKALAQAVGEENYVHIKQFGNVNYKNGGPIQLADPFDGLTQITPIMLDAEKPRDVILLCGCRDVETCHRKIVAEFLVENLEGCDPEIVHLPGQIEVLAS